MSGTEITLCPGIGSHAECLACYRLADRHQEGAAALAGWFTDPYALLAPDGHCTAYILDDRGGISHPPGRA